MDERKQTVFVVDDDPGMRKSLGRLLQSVNLPVETYDSARAFLDGHDPDRTGCLVLDVRMPEMSGLELQEHLRSRRMSLPTIVVSGHADVSMAVRAMKLGSFDFIEKPCSPQQLLECIYKALALDRRARAELRWRDSMKERLHLLSAREKQILTLVVGGQPSKTIAKQLGIAVSTVDNHRANIMKKLGATTPADLSRIAVAADPDFLQLGD